MTAQVFWPGEPSLTIGALYVGDCPISGDTIPQARVEHPDECAGFLWTEAIA